MICVPRSSETGIHFEKVLSSPDSGGDIRGDTTPHRMTGVTLHILHGVVSPDIQDFAAKSGFGLGTFEGCTVNQTAGQ